VTQWHRFKQTCISQIVAGFFLFVTAYLYAEIGPTGSANVYNENKFLQPDGRESFHTPQAERTHFNERLELSTQCSTAPGNYFVFTEITVQCPRSIRNVLLPFASLWVQQRYLHLQLFETTQYCDGLRRQTGITLLLPLRE
jgi:hypothetical protein